METLVGSVMILIALAIALAHWRSRIVRKTMQRAHASLDKEWNRRLEHGPDL